MTSTQGNAPVAQAGNGETCPQRIKHPNGICAKHCTEFCRLSMPQPDFTHWLNSLHKRDTKDTQP